MMPRPRPREEARVWLEFAEDDFRAACGLMAMSPPAIRQALVQGQQAAEKALKAFLIGNGQLYPLTHDLERLRELCVVIDPTLDAVARPCLDLTQFASLMRYPGCPDLPEPEFAWPWLHAAEALVAAVAERLRGAIQEPAAGMK